MGPMIISFSTIIELLHNLGLLVGRQRQLSSKSHSARRLWAGCCSIALHRCRNWRFVCCGVFFYDVVIAGKVEEKLSRDLDWHPSPQVWKSTQTKTGSPKDINQTMLSNAARMTETFTLTRRDDVHRRGSTSGQDSAVHLHLQVRGRTLQDSKDSLR